MSKDQLVSLVMVLQGNASSGECTNYNLNNYSGNILTTVHSPYGDNGTLKWPDGKVFMARTPYGDNGTLYYPNGAVWLSKTPYGDNNSIYWPNSKTMRLRSPYGNNGTISRADGSVWLVRSPYGDDRTRYGLPVDSLQESDFLVTARLTSQDSVISTVVMTGQGWTLEVKVNGETDSATIKECF